MKLKNAVIEHRRFGTGHVTEQTDKYITVAFDADGSVRKLACPMVFDGIAVLTDEGLSEEAAAAVQADKEAKAAARQARLDDYAVRYKPLTAEEKLALKEQAAQAEKEHREALKAAAREAAPEEEPAKKPRKPATRKKTAKPKAKPAPEAETEAPAETEPAPAAENKDE